MTHGGLQRDWGETRGNPNPALPPGGIAREVRVLHRSCRAREDDELTETGPRASQI
jgi:hypothetical protein